MDKAALLAEADIVPGHYWALFRDPNELFSEPIIIKVVFMGVDGYKVFIMESEEHYRPENFIFLQKVSFIHG